MSECGSGRVVRVKLDAQAPHGQQPPYPVAAETVLVVNSEMREVLTARQDTDARTALSRGLAEYLRALVLDLDGGRRFRFESVRDTWAETEDVGLFPALTVMSVGDGVYDASRLTPSPASLANAVPGVPNTYVTTSAELCQDLQLEVWANDPVERMAAVMLLEEALSPVEWRYGCELVLPHYFGRHAGYSPQNVTYMDTEVDATRRMRRATMTVKGCLPVSRLVTLPVARPRVHLAELGQDVIMPVL